ncbi:MAG: hypothetical protein IKK45_00990 [Akkermansia sp.]|nr:hypothetical protein [Akkermansia sp.]
MMSKNRIKNIFIHNWKPKLICLVCAVAVWLMVNHLLVRGESPEWSIDDIRLSVPE